MRLRFWTVFLFVICNLVLLRNASAQLHPEDLDREMFVKLIMKDSSQFYALVLARPVPDRIIVETRNGRLEIPSADISYAMDYRFDYVAKEELRTDALHNTSDVQQNALRQLEAYPKLPETSIVTTKTHDVFRGHRYQFDDSAHVVLATEWGDLFFTYPSIEAIDNYSGHGDRRVEFLTSRYLTAFDPRSSQDYIMPTARSFGSGNAFLSDYMLAGLQLNYGPTDWLSINGGGLFAPFLPTAVTFGSAGIKITPYQGSHIALAAGVQGVYSQVKKITRIGFPYVVATYGTWESELSLLGGISYQSTVDSLGQPYYPINSVIGVSGDMRVGENLKAAFELFFISDFDIVPVVASIRYFQSNLTIDVGVVFSLYKAGGSRVNKTLGEYVFNTNFDIIPVISGSYHF